MRSPPTKPTNGRRDTTKKLEKMVGSFTLKLRGRRKVFEKRRKTMENTKERCELLFIPVRREILLPAVRYKVFKFLQEVR